MLRKIYQVAAFFSPKFSELTSLWQKLRRMLLHCAVLPVLLLGQDKSKAELETYFSAGSQHFVSPFCHQPRDDVQMLYLFLSVSSWAQNPTLKKGSRLR